MSSTEALKLFLGVLGVIIGIPTLVVMVRVGMFFGSLSRSVKSLETSAAAFTTSVGQILDRLVGEVNDHEARLRVLEDRGQ